jgi:hypothetical protein
MHVRARDCIQDCGREGWKTEASGNWNWNSDPSLVQPIANRYTDYTIPWNLENYDGIHLARDWQLAGICKCNTRTSGSIKFRDFPVWLGKFGFLRYGQFFCVFCEIGTGLLKYWLNEIKASKDWKTLELSVRVSVSNRRNWTAAR